ncbi:hypothetical protein ACPV5Q_02500 [Vibrio astriarenae]
MDQESVKALLQELAYEQKHGTPFAVKALIFYMKQILNSFERGETSLHSGDVLAMRKAVDYWLLDECKAKLNSRINKENLIQPTFQ